jgi:predicted phage-related endonuclease
VSACEVVVDGNGEQISSANREAWLAARTTGIGASDAWRLVSEPYALWALKSGLIEDEDLSDVERVQWGNLLESTVIAETCRRAGAIGISSGTLYRSTAYPFALATLDGRGVEIRGGDDSADIHPWFPIEAKTGSAWLADEWADGAPPKYRIQCQWQMLVTGAPRVLLGCLLGGQRLVWSWIERDEATIAALADAGREMWRRVVENDPPPCDGSEASARALAKVYPKDDGETIVLPGSLIEASDELDAVKAQIKAAEAREKVLEAQIKAAIGGASRGLLIDGSGWTWKAQTRAEHVVKASTFRVLRRTKAKED